MRGRSPSSFSFLLPDAESRAASAPSLRQGGGCFAGADRFLPRPLAFLPQVCYNLLSFILAKRERAPAPSRMRTNRGRTATPERGLPPQRCGVLQAAWRSPPPTTAECRGEPLPGVPVTAHREAQPPGRRNSGGTVERSRQRMTGASSRAYVLRDEALFIFHANPIWRKEYCDEDHLQ